jgi:hypothetical protein
MTFFDKKSEVIKIELTPYGKYLLSKGKFKPVYYEFLDNDILYDSTYAGISEERNNISERIKNETPRTKPQYVFSGVETKLKELIKTKNQLQNQRKTAVKDEELIEAIQTYEKLYYNTYPLGNSSLDQTYPALKLNLYNTKIKSFQSYKLANTHPMLVPQIELEEIRVSGSYKVAQDRDIRLENIEENQQSPDTLSLSVETQRFTPSQVKIFPDNTYIEVEDKSVLLSFFEENTTNISENFEIEIYTYETGSGGLEIIKQLYFDNSNDLVIDDPTKVEYYFQIITDNNISSENLEKIRTEKQPEVFAKKK